MIRATRLDAYLESWRLIEPFRISGQTFRTIDVVVVEVEQSGKVGRGEAAGVYFNQDLPATIVGEVNAVRPDFELGIDRGALQSLLRAGGARNALDCALWDLEAKLQGEPVWSIAGLVAPRPIRTVFGCAADTPENMAIKAESYVQARAIKLKLIGEAADAERVKAVRAARPDVWLSVDANQGFDRPMLERVMPVLVAAGVELIE